MVRYGFVMDLTKCQGCSTCVVACKMANLTGPKVQWIKLFRVEQQEPPDVWWIPYHCMHCEVAPCVVVCPTGASYVNDKGVVLVDYSKCIGCGLCVNACPYDARELVKGETYFSSLLQYEEKGIQEGGYRQHVPNVVEKCTMCIDNPETQQYGPACVRHCPTGARMWGDLDDPNSEVAKQVASGKAKTILSALGTKPKVYYIGLPSEKVLAQLPIKARYVIPPPKIETVTKTQTAVQTTTTTQTVTQPLTTTQTLTTQLPGQTITKTESKTVIETKSDMKTLTGAVVGGIVIGALSAYALRRKSETK